jgi:energy-coupling factor transporter ATP-binding protein EcfA2
VPQRTVSRVVQLHTVRVSRAPGIDEPFSIAALSPGLNLVHGPNASGKSTLVRVCEALLWPEAGRWPTLVATGRYRMGETEWQVALDSGAREITANGSPARAPDFPSPTMRHRYVLSLHDLLAATANDGGFAREITRASAGGLDVVQAGADVGASETPARSSAARKAFDEAQTAFRQASALQAHLYARGAELAALVAERDAAAAAATEERLLTLALEHVAARERREGARDAIAQLPTAVHAVAPGVHDEAHALLERWQQRRDEWHDAMQRLTKAREECEATFTLTPPERVHLETWRALVQQWQREEAAVAQADGSRAEAAARREEARRPLGPDGASASLQRITRADVDRLVAVADRIERARSAHEAAHATWQRHVPEADADPDVEQAVVLQDAMRGLVRWLAADAQARGPAPTVPWWMPVLVGIVAVAGWSLAAWQWERGALLGVLVAALLSVWMWRAVRPPAAVPDTRPTYEHDYRALGITPPTAWEREAVIARLHQLAERVARREAHDLAHRQASEAERAHARTGEALGVVEAERAALLRELAISSDGEVRTVAWWLDRFVRWQDAQLDTVAAEQRFAHHRRALDSTRNTLLMSWPDAARVQPPTASAADALLDDLERRCTLWHAAQQRVATEAQRVERLTTQCAALQAEWRGLCERIGVHSPDASDPMHEPAVRAVLEQLAMLERARAQYDALQVAERDAARDELAIAARAGETPDFAAWLTWSPATLAERRDDALAHAERYTSLVSEVARLEQELARARHAQTVEQALAQRDQARATLDEQIEAQVDALLANALVQHVAAQTRDVHRPAVFHRARDLFAQITHGRWRLHLDEDGEEPRFRAEDTRTLQLRALDELSSGTRVQLLVAVRVAFVEHEEGDVRLPLFFDETLGTSDDQRATALIEAVLTLVHQGRQVFYFTAQHDEVAKWEQALATYAVAIPWCAVDLAAVRALPSSVPSIGGPAVIPSPVRAQPPEPTGHSHESYGAQLDVPAIVPGVTPLGATHLWYLLDELPVLHAALSLGIADWGALAWYLEVGGTLPVAGVEADTVMTACATARQHAELLGVLHDYASRGRGRVVDRAGLLSTGAVSDRFVSDVAEVARSCSGGADELLSRLESGVVPGFGAARVSALREAFLRDGFLSTTVSPSAAEIRWAMVAHVSATDAVTRVDTLLDRLRQRMPSRADAAVLPSP